MKIAKTYLIIVAHLLLATLAALAANAQWQKQTVNTTAGLRGLSVAGANVIWASGTGGTFLRTTVRGLVWKAGVVPGAEKLDFRDIEAFDANTAYILSIGEGEASRIYKTTDGGTTWKLQFQNANPKAFFDAMACWDRNNCIAMSDPVDGKFVLIKTTDGENWKPVDTAKMPKALDGEAAFAASGTCIITQGKNTVFIVTGGKAARVFRSKDRGANWTVADTAIVSGTNGSGIFGIAMYDAKNGAIVGGDYEKDTETGNNLAFTKDGGKTWVLQKGLSGFHSGIAYINAKRLIAVGSSDSSMSYDGGKTWATAGKLNYNAVQARGKFAVWVVGGKGLVARYINPFDLRKLGDL